MFEQPIQNVYEVFGDGMSYRELLDRPIAYQRCFVSLGAGVTGALMLSQAVYWSNRTNDNSGWFYKTQEEWTNETGMTRYEQEGARKKLLTLGVIQEKKKGIPCKLYFRVNYDELEKKLQTSMRKFHKLACDNSTGSVVENQLTITENTTENTTDIINTDKSVFVDDENIFQRAIVFSKENLIRPDDKKNNIPYQKIMDLYNFVCGSHLSRCLKLDKKRKANIQKCWNLEFDGSYPFQDLDFWEGYFNDCLDNKFWCGENDRGWKADIEFLTRPDKVLKILEGN